MALLFYKTCLSVFFLRKIESSLTYHELIWLYFSFFNRGGFESDGALVGIDLNGGKWRKDNNGG